MNDLENQKSGDYKAIEQLTEKEKGPVLVRHLGTKEFFVRKCYPLSLKAHLLMLQDVNHKNLPRIQEVSEQQDIIWLYEEYIHGKTLADNIRESERMMTKEILTLAEGILSALIALHKTGLIHRDIKPSNIMLTNDGVVKLIDFDAVRMYADGKETDTVQLGTVGFASPEQFGFAQTDERSDIYSLGVVMNVCSVKQYPKQLISKDPFLHEMIVKATKLDSKDRYQTAAEMYRVISQQILKVNHSLRSQSQAEDFRQSARQEQAKSSKSYANQGSVLKKVSEDQLKIQRHPIKSTKKKTWNIIPGFRTGILWKQIVASLVYFFLIVSISGNVAKEPSFKLRLLEFIDYFMILVLPIILYTNFLNFYERFPLLLSKKFIYRFIGYFCLFLFWFATNWAVLNMTSLLKK